MGQRPDEMSRYDQKSDPALGADAAYRAAGAAEGASGDTAEDTAVIRDEIQETRAEMSETIDAIQERLSPSHIKEQVKEQVREQFHEATTTVRDATIGKAEAMVRNAGDTINEARYGLMDTIRQNPIPAALVGIGLGWMFMNRRSGASHSYNRSNSQGGYYSDSYDWGDRGYARGANVYPRGVYGYRGAAAYEPDRDEGTLQRAQATAGHAANRAQETVGNAVSQAQETASNLASQTQQAVGNFADQAQHQAQRVEDRFQQALYENPLAVGAVALALGTAIGLSLPQTQRENELMGEARDNLIDRAQEVAQSTVQQVQQVAGEVMDQAQTTIQERARERGATNE